MRMQGITEISEIKIPGMTCNFGLNGLHGSKCIPDSLNGGNISPYRCTTFYYEE